MTLAFIAIVWGAAHVARGPAAAAPDARGRGLMGADAGLGRICCCCRTAPRSGIYALYVLLREDGKRLFIVNG